MNDLPAPLRTLIETWPEAAQMRFWEVRAIFRDIADKADVGTLDESLKWQQPAWRPAKARTGSTLRMDWRAQTPDHLSIYVDCKTDLASRMRDIYPDLPVNDGQRHMAISLDDPLPQQAMAHLAEMTFTYHRAKRQSA